MKKIFRRKKKSASEVGSIGSGLSGSAYNVSPKKDLGKLHKAAFEGNLTKLKSLLKRGDVNLLDKENRTPLHLACANGKYDAVRMLCEHPNINLNLCDNERMSALMKCVQCEHQTCLKILLDKEADVSLSDENGNTALHIAASIPNSDICYLLSDYNADPQAKNKDGATALHNASSRGSDEIVKLFLNSGVDVNDADENGKTPLMQAAHKGHLTTVKLLLSKNANPALRDISGWTADDYASMDGYHAISHIITEHNATKGPIATPIRNSTISRTPQTTPQKLGVKSSPVSPGAPAMDFGSDDSDDEDSASVSKAAEGNKKDNSWASSSDGEEPKYATVQKKNTSKKPTINVTNWRKKSADATSPAPTETATNPPQSPSKATTNLFLTASAREQIKKKESEEIQSDEEDNFQKQGMRNRYDSKSARGEAVSPKKPPLPVPRSSASMEQKTSPASKYTPSQMDDDDDNDSWDSSDSESDEEPVKTTPATNMSKEKPSPKLMQQLGFDDNDMKGIYGADNSDTDESLSGAKPMTKTSLSKNSAAVTNNTTTPKKASPATVKQKKQADDDSDSWDDSLSDNKESPRRKGFNFLDKSNALKFDDETDDEAEEALKPPTTKTTPKQSPVVRKQDGDESDESSSWASDKIVKRPEEAPSNQPYISSSSAVLKDAEKMVSPQHKPGLQQKIAEREKAKGLGITYGVLSSDDDVTDSDVESESSWEQENKIKKAELLNNQMDLEKERRLKEEEDKQREAEQERKREEERKEAEEKKKLEIARLEEEKKKKEMEEERKKKEAEEKRKLELALLEEQKRKKNEEKKKQEEEQRRKEEIARQEEEKKLSQLKELEKMNKMNEELERKNAELKQKALEEKKREDERMKLEAMKTTTLNESLRVALEKAADVTSESGDSDADKRDVKAAEKTSVKASYRAEMSSAPLPISGSMSHQRQPYDLEITGTKKVDLDTLTEESDDELSLSESNPPELLLHTSPLSDSLKLAEEKQNLSLQLAREQDAVATAQDKLDGIKKENKQLKLKERTLVEEKKTWELEKVEMNAENRKLGFEVKNLEESVETMSLKLSKQEERSKRMEEQLQVEREERKEQEVLVRDLRIDLKNANAAAKQSELECEELKKKLATERESGNLARTINEDSAKLKETLQNEARKDNQVESLEQVIHEKNQELIKVKAERDRYEDASARYKGELAKLRSQDADQHENLVELNQELNERLDEKDVELRESEEALQLAALQSVQYKQAYENASRKLENHERERESIDKDLDLLSAQQTQLKRDLEDSRSSLLREQERSRKLEDSNEKMREKEAEIQGKLVSAETKASRLENEVQIAQSSNKQRAEDTAKWENECEKMKETVRENDKNISKLQREVAEQSGKIEALKIELHQRETECVQMRQEKEDMRSRNTVSANEQQDKFNAKLTAVQRERENERVAFETRNVQLSQQIEHWKSEVDRIEREKSHKNEELAQAQQDRIEAHKKLGYADAFSKSASKEQKQLMDENRTVKEDNIRLQSQVSLLEQKVEEKSSTVADLQKEVDRFYQSSANANRKIDSLSESQRLVENSRSKLEQQLKDIELENIRLKSELESSNAWKDRLQENREEEAHSKATLEEKVSRLECDKVLAEEKLAAEVANAKILRSEAEGHKSMWEAEVKSRSKLEVELSKAGKVVDEEKLKAETLRNKLTRATEERKTFKTKYEQLKREKMEADRRAESYRSAMHDAGRKAVDTESECESQLSMMDEQHSTELTRRETTIAKLREQVTNLMQEVKEKKRPYFPEGPTDTTLGSDEVKRIQFENEKLKEELQSLRNHVRESYVDKSELEAARQEERIRAQSTLAPTLDQVNSFLKNQQVAQEFRDQLIQKREENTAMKAAMRIASLEDELRALKRKQDEQMYMMTHRQEAEISQLYDGAKRKNDVLEQQLARANNKAEEYKANWIKERKKFQTFFSNTLGGSTLPNGSDVPNISAGNGTIFSPQKLGLSPPPLGGAYSSTPKKDMSDPLLAQLRCKLDATIAQHLSGVRKSPLSHSAPNGHISSPSSGTPRSDRSSHHPDIPATSGHKSTEYMSFLIS